MSVLRILVFPFALIYGLITSLRNWFYDRAVFKSTTFRLPIVSVGNLTVGGTGKTPMTEYLIRLFYKEYQIATLSRGYGRKTKGFRMASAKENAHTIGDEPYQLFRKFAHEINVMVGENRVAAVQKINALLPNTQLILLDDAYQHRAILPGFNILLSDYSRPFYKDWMMPTGNLRERRMGAQRADVVVVTKCPEDLSAQEMGLIENKIRPYTSMNTPIYFAKIDYLEPIPVFDTAPKIAFKKVVLLTAIANAHALVKYLAGSFDLVSHIQYPDHHVFGKSDITNIERKFRELDGGDVAIICTEKDMVKLIDLALPDSFKHLPLYYLPIGMSFVRDGELFNERLKDFCHSTWK